MGVLGGRGSRTEKGKEQGSNYRNNNDEEEEDNYFYYLQPTGFAACQASLSWNSPGKNTGVGSHSLLQGIFLTHGDSGQEGICISRQILYHLSYQGSPFIFAVMP